MRHTIEVNHPKRTIPQPSDATESFTGIGLNEHVESSRKYVPLTKNSHWFRHTFERPRKNK